MGLGRFLAGLFGAGLDQRELARRLGLHPEDLDRVEVAYETFEIPKRSGGARRIAAPAGALKGLQERMLHRLFARLPVHEAAHGFVRGRSIVTHARLHVGRQVVCRMDLVDFFPATKAKRVRKLFRRLGWSRKMAKRLTAWTTLEDGLPQGAPTSPHLSNVLNRRLDARLAGLARRRGCTYSRYADDLVFSWDEDLPHQSSVLRRFVRRIVSAYGYRVHSRKKLRIMRRHGRQVVTGLVVNDVVNLPRETRRWLRAVEHRLRTGGEPTLTAEQIEGWRALLHMVETQRNGHGG